MKSSTTGTPKSIFARIGEFGSGQGPENEEEAIFNAKQTKKKKKNQKPKTIHLRDLFRTGEDADDDDADER